MRMGMLVALILYMLVSDRGVVLGPFNANSACQSYRQEIRAGGHCLPLWQ